MTGYRSIVNNFRSAADVFIKGKYTVLSDYFRSTEPEYLIMVFVNHDQDSYHALYTLSGCQVYHKEIGSKEAFDKFISECYQLPVADIRPLIGLGFEEHRKAINIAIGKLA